MELDEREAAILCRAVDLDYVQHGKTGVLRHVRIPAYVMTATMLFLLAMATLKISRAEESSPDTGWAIGFAVINILWACLTWRLRGWQIDAFSLVQKLSRNQAGDAGVSGLGPTESPSARLAPR